MIYDGERARHLIIDELYDDEWTIRSAHRETYDELDVITIVRVKR